MRTPIACMPGRYTATVVNGTIQHVRDKAALRADIVALLDAEGHLPKKRIIVALHTVKWLVDAVMDEALAAGEIECFRMLSPRGRMDEYWCIFGETRAQKRKYKFNAEGVLAAMQAHAARLANGVRTS